MSANLNKILIIGASSGIGEAFARKLHAAGKHAIITGRNSTRLEKIKQSLPGLSIVQWDICDFSNIPTTAQQILKDHPDLDAVYINAGTSSTTNFVDGSEVKDTDLLNEVNTNFTSAVLLTNAFMPHLVARATSEHHVALIATTSGLAFSPMRMAPVYCATKAAFHSFLVSVRQQVAAHQDPNVHKYLSICEIAPPFVDTGFADASKMPTKPMSLEDYMTDAWGKFEAGEENGSGKLRAEIGTGTAEMRMKAWSDAIRPMLAKIGMKE